MADTNELVLYL